MKKLTLSTRPPVPPSTSITTLLDIHDRFMNLSIMFRTKVCEECTWSLPTYYRKANGEEKAISNAEREKIKDIEKECIKHLMQCAGMLPSDNPPKEAA